MNDTKNIFSQKSILDEVRAVARSNAKVVNAASFVALCTPLFEEKFPHAWKEDPFKSIELIDDITQRFLADFSDDPRTCVSGIAKLIEKMKYIPDSYEVKPWDGDTEEETKRKAIASATYACIEKQARRLMTCFNETPPDFVRDFAAYNLLDSAAFFDPLIFVGKKWFSSPDKCGDIFFLSAEFDHVLEEFRDFKKGITPIPALTKALEETGHPIRIFWPRATCG